MVETSPSQVPYLEKVLGVKFGKPELLQQALTHASTANRAATYENLEFLGDRALALVISHWVVVQFPESDEGDLAKRHTHLVRKEALHQVAQEINLDRYIRVSRGEGAQGTHKQASVMADVMEAVLGAVFLDKGYGAVERLILRLWDPQFVELGQDVPQDPKTALQEWLQAHKKGLPTYKIENMTGPDHAPEVTVSISVQDKVMITRTAGNKKQAELAGAQDLLAQLKKENS